MLHTKYHGYRPCGFRLGFVMFSLYKPMSGAWKSHADLSNRGNIDDGQVEFSC